MKRLKFLFPLVLPVTILGVALLLYLANPPMLEKLRLAVFDTYLVQRPRPYTPLPVKIIDIDDASLNKIGQWPWPRTTVAALVQRLHEAGAAAIALDIVFAEPDRTSPSAMLKLWDKEALLTQWKTPPDHDAVLAKAMVDANVVTGFVLSEGVGKKPLVKAGFATAGDDPAPFLDNFVGVTRSLDVLEQAAAGNGALNSALDRDGVIRKVPLMFRVGNTIYPSLAAEALRVAQGAGSYFIKASGASGETSFGEATGIVSVRIGTMIVPTTSDGKFWIHYTTATPERYIPAWKIMENTYDPQEIVGSIVIVGTSAPGLKDIRATPLNPAANGVEVHAQAIEQIMTGEYLERPDWMPGLEMLVMFVTGILLTILMAFVPALWGALFTLLALAGAGYGSWFAFTRLHFLVDPVTPGIVIVLVYLTESLRKFILNEREKRQIRSAFAQYMSPALVKKLAANPEMMKLGGETREMTFLFSDIRGFTTISEQFDAQGLTRFLNRFLTPMTNIILAQDGYLDKYVGDAIVAFWNAPVDIPNHPEMACRAALKMTSALKTLNEEREKEFNDPAFQEQERLAEEASDKFVAVLTSSGKREKKERKFIPIRIGVGLNTGLCLVGNMGSDLKFNYSVLGDDVNLASRLEGQTKTYGVSIVIGETTAANIQGFATLELDLIRVKGKTEAARIYTLLGDENLAENTAFQQLSRLWKELLEAYRHQGWDQAEALLKQCQAISLPGQDLSGLFTLYAARIHDFKAALPPAGWDGVYEAETK